MGGLVIGLSFYATYFSTNSFIGFAGESYDLGFAWMAMGLVMPVITILMMMGLLTDQIIVHPLLICPRLIQITTGLAMPVICPFIQW